MADDGFALRALRTALSQYPTGVAVVTTRSAAGPVGVTVNSFGSLSLDPPLVLWCLRRHSASLGAFTRAEYFAVNVLAEEERPPEDLTARVGPGTPCGPRSSRAGSGC